MLLAAVDATSNAGTWFLGGIAAVGAVVFAAVKKKGEAVDKASLFYLLAPVPLFALVTWLAFGLFETGADAWDFLFIQVCGLLIGSVHCWLFYGSVGGRRVLTWPQRTEAWSWRHFGFTLLLLLSGIAGLLVVGALAEEMRSVWNNWPALLTLLMPFVTLKAYDMYMGIPTAVYRPWYPVLDELFTYEPHEDLPKVNIKVVLGEDRSGGLENVPFDPNVKLERVYRWILHTHLRDEQELYHSERDGVTYVWGWHFHRQKSGWFRWQRRLDPTRTVQQCKLRNGDTVLAVRDPSLAPLDTVRQEMLRRNVNTDRNKA